MEVKELSTVRFPLVSSHQILADFLIRLESYNLTKIVFAITC